MGTIQSPCIKVCQYDSNGVCFGCRRTKDEAGNWSKYTNQQREAIIKELVLRRNVEGEEPQGFMR